MARTTISLPDELKKRMDGADTNVNWSAVAADSFEIKLGQLATMKMEKTMSDVVQRLRASKIETDDADQQRGKLDGYAWARDCAEAVTLERLYDASYNLGRSLWDSYSVACTATGEDEIGGYSLEEFCEEITGDDYKEIWTDSYACGVVAGATELWGEVKDQL